MCLHHIAGLGFPRGARKYSIVRTLKLLLYEKSICCHPVLDRSFEQWRHVSALLEAGFLSSIWESAYADTQRYV